MSELLPQKTSMPGRLWLVLAIVAFQVLANGFIGFVVLDAVREEASHGARVSGAGLLYFLGYLSIAVAVTLLVCAVLTGTRGSWIRPTVISIEVLGIIGGLINLFSGQPAAFIGIALAIGVIVTLNRDDVREWYSN